jgi:anti-sigma28 factor (negative regulator of flagellin synthesis)
MVDVKKLYEEADKEVAEERHAKAKKALVAALRRRETAQQVVRNCDAEIADLKASIEDGSFN